MGPEERGPFIEITTCIYNIFGAIKRISRLFDALIKINTNLNSTDIIISSN